MKYLSSYRWICGIIVCGYLFLLAFVLSHSISLAYAKSTVATPTPRSTMVSIVAPQAKSTPTVLIVSQTSSFLDPSSIIAIIGLIIAFLSMIVAAVTLFFIIKYVKDTASMAKATRDSADATLTSARTAEKTLQEMKEARDEENAPFVIVYFNYIHSRHQSLYLVVENVGKNVAKDIKLKFIPSLQVSQFNTDQLENNLLLKNGLKSLAPNYKLPIPFDYLMHYFKANLPMEYTVKVTYWWKTPLQPEVFEYPLDLALFKYTDFVTETGLSEIDETLQRLESNFRSYSWSADTTNNLLNHIANAINRGLIIKNRVSISQDNTDVPTILREFVYLWVVDYGKQKEKWGKSFIFNLRAKAALISEELLKSTIILDSHAWTEQLKQVISNLSKLSSMQLELDLPEGSFSSAPLFLHGGHSKEDFENLGDSIITDIKAIVELIDKEQVTTLNCDDKEEAQLPISIEEANSLNGL